MKLVKLGSVRIGMERISRNLYCRIRLPAEIFKIVGSNAELYSDGIILIARGELLAKNKANESSDLANLAKYVEKDLSRDSLKIEKQAFNQHEIFAEHYSDCFRMRGVGFEPTNPFGRRS